MSSFKKFFWTASVFVSISTLPTLALAQSVSSFVVSPTSATSGSTVDFSWALANSGGYSFIIFCSTGVKFKRGDGSGFPCDSRVSSTAVVNDSILIKIVNVSGSTKTVNSRIIPKNASGYDQDSAARDVSLSVSPSPQPIAYFTSNSTTTSPGKAVTVSWVSADLDGVNLQIECQDEIRVTSPSYAGLLPCGVPIFANDLSPSGSLTLNFTNSSVFALPYKLILLPAITPKSYDGTRSATLTMMVASDVLPDPVINQFTASTTKINSGDTVGITWGVSYVHGVNLKISCVPGITASTTPGGAILPCDTYAFRESLAATSSIVLVFQNKTGSPASVSVSIVPAKKAGEYDATRAKNITFEVRPPQVLSAEAAPAPAPAPSQPFVAPVSPVPQPSQAKLPLVKITPKPRLSSGTPTASRQESTAPAVPAPTGISETSGEEAIQGLLLLETGKREAAIRQKLADSEAVEQIQRVTPIVEEGKKEFERYRVVGSKSVRLFRLIPVSMRLILEVSKEGEILEIKKPWWSLFVSLRFIP